MALLLVLMGGVEARPARTTRKVLLTVLKRDKARWAQRKTEQCKREAMIFFRH